MDPNSKNQNSVMVNTFHNYDKTDSKCHDQYHFATKNHTKSLFWCTQLFAHFSYLCNFLLNFLTFTNFCSLFTLLQPLEAQQLPDRKLHIGTPFSAGDVLEDGGYFSCLKNISFFLCEFQNNAQTTELHTAIELK